MPAPTPTSSAADAMALIGETFDGRWYPGFNDYFITRWGPDREENGKSWGIFVNNTLTNVGGCQYQLDEGDEVLWVYNAFNDRPNLALFPEGYPSGSRPLTATATLSQPFNVEVLSYEDGTEDVPPTHPDRAGSAPIAGADVSPVRTSVKGFELVESSNPATVTTNSEGRASITFTQPGWHRIKATVPGASEEEAIRSNRLDVCVAEVGQSSCGALPAGDQARVPPPTVGGGRRTRNRRAQRSAERCQRPPAHLPADPEQPQRRPASSVAAEARPPGGRHRADRGELARPRSRRRSEALDGLLPGPRPKGRQVCEAGRRDPEHLRFAAVAARRHLPASVHDHR